MRRVLLRGGMCPLPIFCRDRAPKFVWAHMAKRMHQIMQIGFKNWFFPYFWECTSPSDTLCTHPTGAKVLLVLNLGAPSYKKSWIYPCHSKGSRKETSGAPNWLGGGGGGEGDILQLCSRGPKLMTTPGYAPGCDIISHSGLKKKKKKKQGTNKRHGHYGLDSCLTWCP